VKKSGINPFIHYVEHGKNEGRSYIGNGLKQEEDKQLNIKKYHVVELENDFKVSIIMPTYNRTMIIKRAINSVINQSFTNWELIIVDDGSTDNTEELIKNEFKEFLNQNKIIYLKENHSGVSHARNQGLKIAKGNLIAYLDTDNYWESNFLERMCSIFKTYPEYTSAYCVVERDILGKHDFLKVPFNRENLLDGNYIDLNSYIHKKELYDEMKGFNEKLTRLVDWELILRYTKNNYPFFLNEVLVQYFVDKKFNNIGLEKLDINNDKNFQKIQELYSDEIRLKKNFVTNFNIKVDYLNSKNSAKSDYYNIAVFLDGSRNNISSVQYIRMLAPFKNIVLNNKSKKKKFKFYIFHTDEIIKIDFTHAFKTKIFDCIIIQRGSLAYAGGHKLRQIIAKCKSLGIKIISEFDDNLFEIPKEHGLYEHFNKRKVGFKYIVNNADLVTVSTQGLYDYFKRNYNSPVEIVKNHLVNELLPLNEPNIKKDSKTLNIGYYGTHTHDKDIELIKKPMLKIIKQFKEKYDLTVKFTVIGGFLNAKRNIFINKKVPEDSKNFVSFITWIKNNSDFDLMVAPLINDKFNKSKSELKYIEYSALGLPAIYSDVDSYNQVIIDGKNGLLAKNEIEWEEKLEKLILDINLREKIVKNAQNDLNENYSLSLMVEQWINILNNVIKEKNTQINDYFDEEYYLKNYPDIKKNEIDPYHHYLKFGKNEGRFKNKYDYVDSKKKLEIKNLMLLTSPIFKKTPLVSIIIINRDGIEHLRLLFKNFENNIVYPNYEIIVVDNNSSDESIEFLKDLSNSLPLKIIENEKNKSFSQANNQAVKIAKGEYLLFLNNDIETTYGWLNEMMGVMLNNKNVGTVGAKLIYPFNSNPHIALKLQLIETKIKKNENYTDNENLFKFYNMNEFMDPFEKSLKTKKVMCNPFAVILVKKTIYNEIGGLDERYIYRCEDIDFGLKLLNNGYDNYTCSTAVLFHHNMATRSKIDSNLLKLNFEYNEWIFNNIWTKKFIKNYYYDKINNLMIYTENPLKISFLLNKLDINSKNDIFLEVLNFSKYLTSLGFDVNILSPIDNEDIDTDILINIIPEFNISNLHIWSGTINIAWIINSDNWLKSQYLNFYDTIICNDDPSYHIFKKLNKNIYHFYNIKNQNNTKIIENNKNLKVCCNKYNKFKDILENTSLIKADKLSKKITNKFINKYYIDISNENKIYKIRNINKKELSKKIDSLNEICINTKEKRSPKIIVSLTSFPERMYDIHYTLYSLLNQSFKPDKLILWLSEEEFPNRLEDVPIKVKNFQKYGLTIEFVEDNLKPYNKLIYSLEKYPEDIIVTADDDVFYPKNWLKQLYDNYDGENVVCHRAHRITFEDNGKINPYLQWQHETKSKQIDILNFFTGVGGVLYPPRVFYKDVLNNELFLKISPSADDIWFWAMAVLNNKNIKIVPKGYSKLIYINPKRELGLNNEKTLLSKNIKRNQNNENIKHLIDHYPEIKNKLNLNGFNSKEYWEKRYIDGGHSGAGSYNFFAEFKAEVINKFVLKNNIDTVIEFGHGDGNQLKLSNYPKYLGFDVSSTIVELCKNKFKLDKTKKFKNLDEYNNEKADLTLSLDVIYHLIEDDVFNDYMYRLFNASLKYVIIYSSNDEQLIDKANHVKHRKFSDWIENNMKNWKLIDYIPNKYPYTGDHLKGSFADFYVYKKD
jgi:GT2 family glycosyltransferase